MLVAVTRPVSSSLAQCELTHLAREPIDFGRAAAQHERYVDLLRSLGATIVSVPDAHELPDAVFIEDIAVVLERDYLRGVLAFPESPVRARHGIRAATHRMPWPPRALCSDPDRTTDGCKSPRDRSS